MSPKVGTCGIEGCSQPAKRSISAMNLSGTTLKVRTSSHRVNLCRDHYKQFKKETKQDRAIEKARFNPLGGLRPSGKDSRVNAI
ncbi:MAG TPA: hypothetical protein VMS77_04335 [Conexivisphaerales archaeon]|nr:hypothetical protein [Conexivisphaerales archaeon]